MIEYKIVLSEDDYSWDKFQDDSSEGNVYLYSRYINSLNIDNDRIYLKDKQDNILASAVIFKDFGRIPYSLYQGISISKFSLSNQKKLIKNFTIISEFLNLIILKYDKVFFTLSPNFTDLRPFQWLNFHEEDKPKFNLDIRYTGIIYLDNFKDFADYLKTIRSVRRRTINHANRNKLKVLESNDIDLFIDLFKKTFDRQSIEVSNLEMVRSIILSSIDYGYGRMTFCVDDCNNVHSGMVILKDKYSAYYAFGASDPEYRKSDAATVLMGDSIKNAFDHELRQFDMCGVNSPNRGDFKLSFNANLIKYFEVQYSN